MSWCDKLASTPSVGFLLDPHFASGDAIFSSLAPLLNNWAKKHKDPITLDRHESFAVGFTTVDGFQYGVDTTRVHVNFTHRMKARAVSAGPPTMEMLSKPLPYTELLPEVSARLIEATLLLPEVNRRKVTRIGIISTTAVSDDQVPPGIARFIKYIGRPWKAATTPYSMQITGDIEKTSTWSDRCIHVLSRKDERDDLINIKFDWQRIYESGRPIRRDTLKEAVAAAERSALKYFEDLAEGNRFDEDLIRETT